MRWFFLSRLGYSTFFDFKGNPLMRIHRTLAVLVLILALFFGYGKTAEGEETPPLPETVTPIHAAQILLFKSTSLKEIEEMLERLKEAGTDTLLFRVFQNRHDRFHGFAEKKNKVGVYFNSSTAPVVDDALSKILPLAKKHGLKVFAWMTTRQTDWLLEKHPEWADQKYDFKSKKFSKDQKIDLFHPEARRVLLNIFRDLAAYEIDGILFQDDLVYRYTEGFSPEARKAFARETSHAADPHLFYKRIVPRSGKLYATEFSPVFWDWVRWKNRSLLKFADEISRTMKETRPSLKIALNLYYETVMEQKNGLAWLAQDFQESLRYSFDYFSVMAYHLQVKKALGLTDQQVVARMGTLAERLVNWLDNPARALIKIQVKDWESGKPESAKELEKVFQAVTQAGKTSLAFVPCDQDAPLKTIRRFFKPENRLAEYPYPRPPVQN